MLMAPAYNLYGDSFIASGQIIDGWQRINGEFTVPEGSLSI